MAPFEPMRRSDGRTGITPCNEVAELCVGSRSRSEATALQRNEQQALERRIGHFSIEDCARCVC